MAKIKYPSFRPTLESLPPSPFLPPKMNFQLQALLLELLTTSQRLSFKILTIPDPLQGAIIIEPHTLTLMDIGVRKLSSSSKSGGEVKVNEVMNQIGKREGDVNLGLHGGANEIMNQIGKRGGDVNLGLRDGPFLCPRRPRFGRLWSSTT
jgi:hypothetical protein